MEKADQYHTPFASLYVCMNSAEHELHCISRCEKWVRLVMKLLRSPHFGHDSPGHFSSCLLKRLRASPVPHISSSLIGATAMPFEPNLVVSWLPRKLDPSLVVIPSIGSIQVGAIYAA